MLAAERDAAPDSLASAIDAFEALFGGVVDFGGHEPPSHTPRGAPYLTVTSGGVREGGSTMPVKGYVLRKTEAEARADAVARWMRHATQIARGKKTLRWRTKPTIESMRVRDIRMFADCLGNNAGGPRRAAPGGGHHSGPLPDYPMYVATVWSRFAVE